MKTTIKAICAIIFLGSTTASCNVYEKREMETIHRPQVDQSVTVDPWNPDKEDPDSTLIGN